MIEQRTPEWFSQRKNRVTASLVGAILGVSPFMTRNQAMRAMVRDSLGAENEFAGNPAVSWGNANENTARLDFEMDTGIETSPAPFVPFEDWAGASPDAYIGNDALLEIKCPYGLRKDVNPSFKSLKEQPHYYAQVQFQMFCTGRNKAWFFQWSPYGSDITEVEFDKDWHDCNLPVLRQFYAEFLHELANNADEHLHQTPRIDVDTPLAYKMIREWDEIAEQAARLEERKKDLLKQIVAAAGEQNANFGGRKLTLTKKAGTISYAKAIKELCPGADLEKWRGKPSEFWALR